METPDKFQAALRRLNADAQPIHLEISKGQMFVLIGQLQLACRHPGNRGPSRQFTESFVRDVSASIAGNDNDLRLLIEMGWNHQFDANCS